MAALSEEQIDKAKATVKVARRKAATAMRLAAERLHAAPEPTPEPTPDRPLFPTAPARPVPDGWTEERIRQVMHTLRIDDTTPGQWVPYVEDSLWRFLHTYGLAAGEAGRALELGGNPYFTTWLLREFTDLELTVANYFDGSGPGKQHVSMSGEGRTYEFSVAYDQFNIESEPFPYEDDSFDTVLFCEIIEHLGMDPLHPLREINRILRPGGAIVLTTPNVCRVENAIRIATGHNIYDPYSAYGPYGRHNREYTQGEAARLLAFAGFEVETMFTADGHPYEYVGRDGFAEVAPLLDRHHGELGQYLFFKARKVTEPREGLPSELYRSYPETVDWS